MIESDIQKLSPGALIDLYQLDATGIGGENIYFHSGVNALGNTIVWQGVEYFRYPLEAEGFEKTGSGSLPRPTLRVANITGLVSTLSRQYQDLVGAKIIRRRTFAKYLDAINYPGGVNPSADPNVHFPDEVWFIDRKAKENPIYVEFELAASIDMARVQIPRRQCIQNVCTWGYRSAECGYTGGPVATVSDAPTSNPDLDVCGKRLRSCKLRFGNSGQLPFGGFPGVGLIR